MAAATVHVTLQSPLNISFDHMIDTEIEVEEWETMTAAEKAELVEFVVWANLDAFASDETGEPI